MKAPERARPRELHLAARPVENLKTCTFTYTYSQLIAI